MESRQCDGLVMGRAFKFMAGRLGGSVGEASAFGSGHDPGVPGLSPVSGFQLSGESATPFGPPPLVLALSLILSLKYIKSLKKFYGNCFSGPTG